MKKLLNRRSLDFDLTPLLDVIFIILMVVMCKLALDNNVMTTRLDDATSTKNTIETQADTYSNVNKLVAFITLNADYESGNPKNRHIKLAYNDDSNIIDIVITPDTEKKSFDDFNKQLEDFIEANKDKPVLLTLDEERILYRDHLELSRIIEDLQKKYNNLYKTDQNDQDFNLDQSITSDQSASQNQPSRPADQK